MIKLSNSKLISIFTILLVLLVIAKGISLFIWWYFPSDGVELSVKENYQPKYQRVNFKCMIINEVKKTVEEEKPTDSGQNIKDMILKGLYGKGNSGFVIVAMKATPKETSIVEVGEIFHGYTLKAIFVNSAKFHKEGSDFILSFEETKITSKITKVKRKVVKKDPLSMDAPSNVSRSDITYYAKNPKQIWKDISIKEIREGKKIKGFKIAKIDPKSRFATLGLQKGDLIIKANNVRLESYREALEIYKKIDKLDMIQIVVIRDNQEVELVYEIN